MCKVKEIESCSRLGFGKCADLEGREDYRSKSNSKKSKFLVKVAQRRREARKAIQDDVNKLCEYTTTYAENFYETLFVLSNVEKNA